MTCVVCRQLSDECVCDILTQNLKRAVEISDAVNSATYCCGKSMQAIDVIEAFTLGYNLGNAIKYILRAGKKDEKAQDLQKALWYITRELAHCD